MADPITIVGLVASIVQLVEAVTKLKRICGAVKDASTDISDLVAVLSISKEQLKRSERYFARAELRDVALVSECFRYLEQAVLAVDTVTSDIQITLRHHKMVGLIKFVSRSRRIQELKQKLKDAQVLMDRTERSIEQIERERASIAQLLLQQKVEDSHDLLVQMFKQVMQPTQLSSVAPPSSPSLAPQLALESPARNPLIDTRHRSRYQEYKITLPRWFWSKSFSVALERQKSSISLRLRCYNIVSVDSDIFKAVRDGDVDTVKYLFKKGDADPFVISLSGCSLLSEATSSRQPRMCQFLIDQGADIGYVDHRGYSALHCLSEAFVDDMDLYVSKDYKTFKQIFIELIEVLATPNSRDDHYVEELRGTPWCANARVYLSSMRFLLKGAFSNIQSISHEDRNQMIIETDSLDVIEVLLGQDLSAREVFTYAKTNGLPYWKYLLDFLRKSDEERRRWVPFIRDLIAVKQSLMVEPLEHSMDPTTSIVDFTLCRDASLRKNIHLLSELPRQSNDLLQKHLVTLQNLGADLGILGREEQYIFHEHGCSGDCWDFSRSLCSRWRMIGLETGPLATDWKIWLAPDSQEYEWAGQFWHWIENPELYIPGAFMEDDLY